MWCNAKNLTFFVLKVQFWSLIIITRSLLVMMNLIHVFIRGMSWNPPHMPKHMFLASTKLLESSLENHPGQSDHIHMYVFLTSHPNTCVVHILMPISFTFSWYNGINLLLLFPTQTSIKPKPRNILEDLVKQLWGKRSWKSSQNSLCRSKCHHQPVIKG